MSRVIAVVGGTGNQGLGLVNSILKHSADGFKARIVTRDPAKAKALVDQGAEAVAADIDDEASLTKAFSGCYGAYCVTPFLLSPEKETKQGQNMAAAAKAAGLKHVIWSTLEDTRKFIPLSDPRMPVLHNHYKVPHFDCKADADAAFVASGVPTTFLLTSFYYENFSTYFPLRKSEDGSSLTLALPMGQAVLVGNSCEDIGKTAYGIFKFGPEHTTGKYIGVAGDVLPASEYAKVLSSVIGKPVHYYPVPFDAFRKFPFPGADDLGNMFQFYHDCAYTFTLARNRDACKVINPELQTFAEWAAKNKDKIRIE